MQRPQGTVVLTVSNQNQTAVDVTVRLVGAANQTPLHLHVPARSSAEVNLSNRGPRDAAQALWVVATGPVVPQRWVVGGPRTVVAYGTADTAPTTLRPMMPPMAGLVATLNADLTQFVRLNAVSGSVLISRKGRPLLRTGYGFADRAQSIRAQLTTTYPIRGLTTGFTAVAILQLQDRGKLSVKDPMCRYLPICPQPLRALTIAQLLTHTSGLPSNPLDPTRPFTVRRLLTSFGSTPPRFTPGTRWRFSDTGYVLLGAIIEKVSGLPYRTYIHNSILKRLGMTSTGFLDEKAHPPLALGYHGTIRTTRNAGPSYDPAWGMYSTVMDLEQFNAGLNAHRVLSPGSTTSIFAPHIRFSNGLGYGYAWNSGVFQGHRFNVSYGAHTPGYAAAQVRMPNDGITMIILSNQDEAPMARLVSTLIKSVVRP